MDSKPVFLLSFVIAIAAYVQWKLIKLLLGPYVSSLRYLPGPTSRSWLLGNLQQVHESSDWMQRFGDTFKFKGLLNSDVLFTIDLRALHHILNNITAYSKPEVYRLNVSAFVGEGLLLAEGEQHGQQRRVMNPAFGPAQIRDLTGIFVQKSIELTQFWQLHIGKHGETARIDVLDGLSKMTLDVIGLAGFGYHFNSLSPDGKETELNEAFNTIFGSGANDASLFKLFRLLFPLVQHLPVPGAREVNKARRIMRRIGMHLVRERKDNILSSAVVNKRGGLDQRDLLTLLTKANTDASVPENQSLSDEAIIAQIPTFLVAGHETTSNTTAWALYALSIECDMQTKLREECLALSTDNPSMDDLNKLPYLEAVVRETLRLHPPLNYVLREATKDDIIPLSKPYIDVHGKIHDHVKIDKGTMIQIPILAVNRSKAIWGEDALEFRPERWDNVPEAAQKVPGTWGNTMTFLGGPRACIGYRFSLVEMKALIFTLIRAFEFELAVPYEDVVRQNAAVQRPILRNAMDKGSQLPMLVRPYQKT
ncbi:cytochrome P450 monooxygenase [Fomitopsis serialis]|uniref:cytochrome P450 monooxygenase n=1 Tax=Fomitopsis serialis TaxID=139415 RepID=UPI00200725E5|nr:cytochrome P450 monooxygenase [Neoantrodia serialis]KAH9910818.1 cytochrome P450 monooxygenase [Neoantrodia serialis]